jgi:hypothetical protein
MTFFCIKVIKGHGYLYRQTSRRHGKQVISITKYVGPVEGGTPWSVRDRPRQPGVSRINLDDPLERELTQRQLQLGIAIAAERLARAQQRQEAQDRKARRIRSIEFELGALRHLIEDEHLWPKL